MNPKTDRICPLEPRAIGIAADILKRGGTIGAACSGGADSVFALLSILDVFPQYKNSILVLHFNHKVRANAEVDEAFVKNLAEGLGLKFVCGHRISDAKNVSEGSLRDARMEFFNSEADKRNLSAIIQGHHKGDVAETAIMRLMRGSGTGGLCAPRPVSHNGGTIFLRPLLNFSKDSIKAELVKRGQVWREDESNARCDFLRNKIRNKILPELEKTSERGFENGAARSRMLLEEDDDALGKILHDTLASSPALAKNSLVLPEIIASNKALARRAVYALSKKCGAEISNRPHDIDALVEKISCGKNARVSSGDVFLLYCAKFRELLFAKNARTDFKIALKAGMNYLPSGSALEIRTAALSPEEKASLANRQNNDAKRVFLNPEIRPENLSARNILKSDAYAPIGSPRPRNTLNMLAAGKIDILKRKLLPIVLEKNIGALWIPGLTPCKSAALDQNPQEALILTYHI